MIWKDTENMLYHGFYVKFTSLENIQREKKDGSIDLCGGFQIEIFFRQFGENSVGCIHSSSWAWNFEQFCAGCGAVCNGCNWEWGKGVFEIVGGIW